MQKSGWYHSSHELSGGHEMDMGGGGGGGGGAVVLSAGPEAFITQTAQFERSAASRDSQTIYTTSSASF